MKESRLWNPAWEKMAPSQKLEALRETVLEIVEAIQQEPSFELKNTLEKKVDHAELRAIRESDEIDIEEKIDNKINVLKRDIEKKLNEIITTDKELFD